MAVEDVDRENPYCWLALADVATGGAEPRLSPANGCRLWGLVDKGGVVADEPAPGATWRPRPAHLPALDRVGGDGGRRRAGVVAGGPDGGGHHRPAAAGRGLLFLLVAMAGALAFDELQLVLHNRSPAAGAIASRAWRPAVRRRPGVGALGRVTPAVLWGIGTPFGLAQYA
jgi:hypothetical protein